ncbi:MAG: acyltransferase, partial [Hyphomicrobiales bacterium]|nr:acyltransferase [Hyphomicrobiales bacterium]
MTAEGTYRREIDGLRAVAVVPVVLYHAGFAAFRGGFLGVDIFFVISGYLITRLIKAEIERGEFSLLGFYERRVRRILPALYLVVVVSLAFAWVWLFPTEMMDFGRSVVGIALFGSNIVFNQAIGYFTGDVGAWPLIHTWSLAVEEQFYALFPFVLIVSLRFGRWWTIAAVATLSALSFSAAQAMSQVDPQSDFYLPQFRAWELGVGALVALARPERFGLDARWRSCLAGLGAGLVVFALVAAPRDLAPSLWSLAPVGGAALLIAFARPDNAFGKLLAAKPLVGVGLVSYSAYLWHQPLFAFARFRFNVAPASLAMALLCAAAFALAAMSWRWIERPFRDRDRFSRVFVFGSALLVGVALLVAGRVIVIERGLPGRMPPIAGRDDIGAYRNACLDLDDVQPASLLATTACRLGVKAAPPDFLLIGDSHAASLADGLDEAAKRAGRSGLVVAANACLPILGLRSQFPRSRPACRRLHDNLLDIVDQLKIKLVVMHARWEAMDEQQEVDDEPNVRMASGDDLARRLAETISALAAHGAKVVIVTSTPHGLYQVPDILARKTRYGLKAEEREDRSQFLIENRTAFRLFADAAVRGQATTIDLYPFFCDR